MKMSNFKYISGTIKRTIDDRSRTDSLLKLHKVTGVAYSYGKSWSLTKQDGRNEFPKDCCRLQGNRQKPSN